MAWNKTRLLFIGVGIVLGGAIGYWYYATIGCASGTCAITSKPLNSTLYGMFLGGLVLDMANDFREKRLAKNTQEEEQ